MLRTPEASGGWCATARQDQQIMKTAETTETIKTAETTETIKTAGTTKTPNSVGVYTHHQDAGKPAIMIEWNT